MIVDQEEEKGDWCVSCPASRLQPTYQCLRRGFKALKQSTKLLFLHLHRPTDALATYIQLLTYTKSAVTRNYSEKTINGILDYVGGGKGGPVEVEVLERFYQATKDALIEAKNEVRGYFLAWGGNRDGADTVVGQRLSVKTNLKLAKLWLDRKEYDRLSKVCMVLHHCERQS